MEKVRRSTKGTRKGGVEQHKKDAAVPVFILRSPWEFKSFWKRDCPKELGNATIAVNHGTTELAPPMMDGRGPDEWMSN